MFQIVVLVVLEEIDGNGSMKTSREQRTGNGQKCKCMEIRKNHSPSIDT
jgi:hypothetical protein